MEGDWQLEAEATHATQETIFCSPSLAQTHLTRVVDGAGQRDVFTVPGALDPVLFLHWPCGQSLPGRLLILRSPFARTAELCSVLFPWRSCHSPSPPLPSRLAFFRTFVYAWSQTYPLFHNSLVFPGSNDVAVYFPSAKALCRLLPCFSSNSCHCV